MHLLNRVINRSLNEFTKDPTAQAIDPIYYEKFEQVIAEYPRSDPDENGGLAFQAICYAYLSETYKEFSVVAASVRTGSSRQKRIGDIDIYEGHSLHLTCEVKDMEINALYRTVKTSEIAGGSMEIRKLIVAKELLQRR